MYPGLPLYTPRLTISEPTLDDIEPFFAMHSDPDVMRYLTGGPWEREYAQQILRNLTVNSRNHPLDFVAVRHKDQNDLLGMVCLLNLPAKHREAVGGGPYVEIGWRFLRQHWNNGYATEAARAVLSYGFETLDLEQIVCIVDARNTASLRVAEKIGLQRVKTYPLEGKEIVFHTIDRPRS